MNDWIIEVWALRAIGVLCVMTVAGFWLGVVAGRSSGYARGYAEKKPWKWERQPMTRHWSPGVHHGMWILDMPMPGVEAIMNDVDEAAEALSRHFISPDGILRALDHAEFYGARARKRAEKLKTSMQKQPPPAPPAPPTRKVRDAR